MKSAKLKVIKQSMEAVKKNISEDPGEYIPCKKKMKLDPRSKAAQSEGDAVESADQSEGGDAIKEKVAAAQSEGDAVESADQSEGGDAFKEKVVAAQSEGDAVESADQSEGGDAIKEKVAAAQSEGDAVESADQSEGLDAFKEKVVVTVEAMKLVIREFKFYETELKKLQLNTVAKKRVLTELKNASDLFGKHYMELKQHKPFILYQWNLTDMDKEQKPFIAKYINAIYTLEIIGDQFQTKVNTYSHAFEENQKILDEDEKKVIKISAKADRENNDQSVSDKSKTAKDAEDISNDTHSESTVSVQQGWPNENLLSLDDFLSDNPQKESFSGEPTFEFETGKDILPSAILLCSSSQDNFPNMESLNRDNLLNDVAIVCKLCTLICTNVRIFMAHVTKEHKSYTVCPECFEAVESKWFSNHAAKHPASSKGVHHKFKTTSSMNPLMNIKQLACRVCCKIFSTRYEMEKHEKDRHKDALYNCKICGKLFLTQFDLQKHSSEKHLAIQRSICKVCYLDFCNDLSLSRHLRGTHDMIVNKTPHEFECNCCHIEFGNKIRFTQHIRVNHQNHALVVQASQGNENGTPKTKCPHCSSHFKNPKVRAIHEIIFHETPPYKCFCNKAFFTKATLDEHILQHTRIMVERMKPKRQRSKKSV